MYTDTFRIIYRILNRLNASMDCEEFPADSFTADAIHATDARFHAILELLQDAGLISTDKDYPRITLKGLEYLETNSLMQEYRNGKRR